MKKGKKLKIHTVNASCNGKRGQSGSVIAIRSNRSLRTCSKVSQVLAQLAIENITVRSGDLRESKNIIIHFIKI